MLLIFVFVNCVVGSMQFDRQLKQMDVLSFEENPVPCAVTSTEVAAYTDELSMPWSIRVSLSPPLNTTKLRT